MAQGDLFYVSSIDGTKYFRVDRTGAMTSGGNGTNVTMPGTLGLSTAGYTSGAGSYLTGSQVLKYTIPASLAVVASTTGVHAAITDTGEQQVVTTGITNPGVPRNVTATAGGTAGDIKAIQVVIAGTNMNDEAITETLSAFTVDTAGTVTGAKIFKTITSITVPAHDGTGATTAVGFGNKFGIPAKLTFNTVLAAALNGVKEGTAPTVTVSSSVLESNGFTLNSTPNSTQIDLLFVPV